MPDFVHNDPEFVNLIAIVSSKIGVDITLVEKDYWIMHSLYSLQHQQIEFELKGGGYVPFKRVWAYLSIF